jgi:predicted MPP superfamily phosphohydrolase
VSTPRVAPRRHPPARRFLFALAERCARLLGGRAYYRRWRLGPGRFRVRHEVLEIAELPAVLEGFRIAHLSDLHAGPFLGRGDLRHVLAALHAEAPDAVALTGDFCAHQPEDALRVLPDLAQLQAPSGCFAVFGNHDYRGRREHEIAAQYGAQGVRFLRNEGVRLQRDGESLPLVITGLEDLEEARELDVHAARKELRPGDVEVLLCHNPLGARVLARKGCAAILSGHTHGTQVDLPYLRGLGPAHPGLRVDLGTTSLIVSRGLGVVGLPIRVGVPAELVLVELRSAASGATL